MRKITAVILVLILSLSTITPVFAADRMQVSVAAPKTKIAEGDTFTVQVSVSGNPGFCSMSFVLSFDETLLTCKSAAAGAVTKKMIVVGNPNGSQGARIAAAGIQPAAGDGVVAEFSFTAKKDGDCTFSLEDCQFYDVDDSEVAVTKTDASLTIAPKTGGGTGRTEGGTGRTEGGNGSASSDKKDEPAEKPEDTADTKDTKDTEDTEDTEDTDDTAGTDAATDTAADPVVELFVAPEEPTFSDVPKTHWGYYFVERAAAEGLVSGTGNGRFTPDTMMTRAQFATILWKINGKPVPAFSSGLADIPEDTWYTEAVYWAIEQKYMDLVTGNTFRPEEPIVRQDIVTSFCRATDLTASGWAEAASDAAAKDTYEKTYADIAAVADYAKDAMYWAVTSKIVSGTSAVNLSPDKTATRAQAATLFLKYIDYLKTISAGH